MFTHILKLNAGFTSQIRKELGGQFHDDDDDDEFNDEQNLKCVKFIYEAIH